MPTQIRQKGAGKRIAFALLGIPANMLVKKTNREKKIDDTLFITQSRTSSRIF